MMLGKNHHSDLKLKSNGFINKQSQKEDILCQNLKQHSLKGR